MTLEGIAGVFYFMTKMDSKFYFTDFLIFLNN